jgi:hypothetical protein
MEVAVVEFDLEEPEGTAAAIGNASRVRLQTWLWQQWL